MNKDVKAVRYSYSITTALLVGGAAITLMTGYPAGAQVAQNENLQISNAVPVAGAPGSFADLTAEQRRCRKRQFRCRKAARSGRCRTKIACE